MCTVSWLHTADGYHLLCNRDERLTRKPAAPPAVGQFGGVRSIAPSDGDHGGTWIGVNEFGLALCLLNRYEDEATGPPEGYTSRGLLVLDLLDARSKDILDSRTADMELSRFQPFTLVSLAPNETALIIHWTGRERLIESNGEARMPLVSSSFDTRGVDRFRKNLFERMSDSYERVDSEVLQSFHLSHAGKANAYSPCMHRADAETVSFSWVKVTGSKIEFLYKAASPCSDKPMETVEMKRAGCGQ